MSRLVRRRGILRRTRSASVVSTTNTSNSLTPITAHYSLNMTLKKAFYKLRESCQYSTALAVGMQFCRIALLYIPQHGYYNSPKYEDLKVQNAQDAVLIADLIVVEIFPRVQSSSQHDNRRGKRSTSDLEEKLHEAKTLREAARENAKSVISERSRKASNLQFSKGGGVLKDGNVEVIDHHLDSSPSWFGSCGACGTLMCGGVSSFMWPTSNPLTAIRETDSDNQRNDGKKRLNPTSFPASTAPYEYPVKFERSTSAPPMLWQDSNQKKVVERQISSLKNKSQQLPTFSSHSLSLVEDDKHAVECPQETPKIKCNEEQFQSDLDRALYLSNLELQRHSQHESYHSPSPSSSSIISHNPNASIAIMASKYHDKFHKMNRNQKINVHFLNTYQGRIRESTNACTVIAPLMAIHHLCDLESLKARNPILMEFGKHYSYNPNNPAENKSNCILERMDDIGIKDDIIKAVIDIQASLVVPKVRKHLGLHRDALIVPSDVHDYLINKNFLRQNQFFYVHGGNILDNDHLEAFLTDFSQYGFSDEDRKGKNENQIKKVAATLYFHEHVICIQRITGTRYNNKMINCHTMKQPKTIFFRSIGSCGKKSSRKHIKEFTCMQYDREQVIYDVIDSLPSASTFSNLKKGNSQCCGWLQQTTRVRCIGRESLKTYLMWYACSKFSQEDEMFIDSYQFDPNKVDLDPRVFQIFTWSE